MANDEESRSPQSGASQSNAPRSDSTRDPEFEIPDPEQVDRDVEQAEKTYGNQQQPRPNKGNEKVA